jgi:hypothetical protein
MLAAGIRSERMPAMGIPRMLPRGGPRAVAQQVVPSLVPVAVPPVPLSMMPSPRVRGYCPGGRPRERFSVGGGFSEEFKEADAAFERHGNFLGRLAFELFEFLEGSNKSTARKKKYRNFGQIKNILKLSRELRKYFKNKIRGGNFFYRL